MIKKHAIRFLAMAMVSFAGGLVAQPLLRVGESFAQEMNYGNKSFYDHKDQLRFEMGMVNGQPTETIYGEEGLLRIQIGSYSPGGNEKGLPAISMYDNRGRLKLQLRVADGNNQSPLLVMKDSHQQDRIVMGLAIDDPGEEPFLAYFDKAGGKHLAFGAY